MEVNRKNKLLFGLLAVAVILLAKLFYIQVIDSDYKKDASNNSMVYSVIYPPRGVIYDRNGEILVGNSVCYDILVTPRDVKQLDTLALAAALDTSVQFIREKMQYYRKYRSRIGYQTQTLLKQVSMETYVKFAEQEYHDVSACLLFLSVQSGREYLGIVENEKITLAEIVDYILE